MDINLNNSKKNNNKDDLKNKIKDDKENFYDIYGNNINLEYDVNKQEKYFTVNGLIITTTSLIFFSIVTIIICIKLVFFFFIQTNNL